MRRVVAVVAVLALLLGAVGAAALYLARWWGSESGPTYDARPLPTAPDPQEAPPGLEKFYGQMLAWQECGDHQCTWLTVPLDYSEPEGRTIRVRVLKVPAKGEALGSMVVNPGGPGAPGTRYASQASMVFGRELRRNFDVVGFDPRGTGRSAPVDCLSDADLDTYVASDPAPETPAEIATTRALAKKFGEGCAQRSGDLVDHVSTVEAARDMDVLRAALDDARLTYFGASYGTKLGATYAELFPDRVGRMVLDGGVDVSLDSVSMAREQAAGFETALRAYVANCVETTERCFLGSSVDEGVTTITDLLADIEEEPLQVGDRELTGGLAFYGVVTPLYVSDYWFMLSTALRRAKDGDGAMLLSLADMYAGREGSGYADNSMEAIYAINCLDDPSFVPWKEVPEHFDEFEEASPTFGRVFAWGLAGCAASRGRTTEAPVEVRGEGADPIVVVGTTRAPATPYDWSVALAEQLESGVLLSRDGDGHTGYGQGNECVDVTVERYLVEGVVPEDGTTC